MAYGWWLLSEGDLPSEGSSGLVWALAMLTAGKEKGTAGGGAFYVEILCS